MISEEFESDMHSIIVGAAQRASIDVLAIGGLDDHIHLVISVPPRMSVATAMSRIKGASSYVLRQRYNHHLGFEFGWQSEYGVTSLSERHLDQVCAYVRNQRERHAQQRTVAGLELTSPGAKPPG